MNPARCSPSEVLIPNCGVLRYEGDPEKEKPTAHAVGHVLELTESEGGMLLEASVFQKESSRLLLPFGNFAVDHFVLVTARCAAPTRQRSPSDGGPTVSCT